MTYLQTIRRCRVKEVVQIVELQALRTVSYVCKHQNHDALKCPSNPIKYVCGVNIIMVQMYIFNNGTTPTFRIQTNDRIHAHVTEK